VDAELYKLLLYETGGHFKPHTDTEKVPGMFATLVVQLPSVFTGGAFVVRHHEAQRSFVADESDPAAAFECRYVAHYADCTHEILPITAGSRLAAVYSLCWRGDGAPPTPPPADDARRLAARLTGLDECVGYILEHRYTAVSLARLGVRALKGRDRAVADALLAAGSLMPPAAQSGDGGGLIIHLARAERLVDDQFDGCDFGPGPRLLCTADDVFRADGSPADGTALGLLGRFRFYEDVVNRVEWDDAQAREETSWMFGKRSDVDDEMMMPYFTPNKVWWEDAEGKPITYWGNEGGGGKMTYHCFVLTAWRAGGAFERDGAAFVPGGNSGEGPGAAGGGA
jgi:hypothetical protein